MRSIRVASVLCLLSCASTPACGSGDGSVAETGGSGGQASGVADSGGPIIGTGGEPETAGADGGASQPPAKEPCDVTRSPLEEKCLVNDEFAVFVSAGASGRGTRDNPIGKLGDGIALARESGKIVLACNAPYDERVVVERGSSGVRVFGGFACPGGSNAWAPDSSERARIAPTAPGVALTVDDVFGDVVFSNIDVKATGANMPSASSLAVHVAGSMNVRFESLTITAGRGGDGIRGADGHDGEAGAESTEAQDGKDAKCRGYPPVSIPGAQLGGDPAPVNGCGSQGGVGSYAMVKQFHAGFSGVPLLVTNGGADARIAGEAGEDGGDGANGISGAVGLAADAAGVFNEHGFVPADGHKGASGTPGQGGGGGGSSLSSNECIGASGGAGGQGGCGGAAAEGGTGGGASVGVLIWDSSTTLASVTIAASGGGNGGDGGLGGVGGLGRFGGHGGRADSLGADWGGRGGDGGWGGSGGAGSGATGGPSHALVVHGSAPNQIDVTLKTWSGGKGGKGGVVKTTTDINPAPNGEQGRNDLMLTVP